MSRNSSLNELAYQRSRIWNGQVYWAFKKYGNECNDRAIISDSADGESVEVFKETIHMHLPNVDENTAEHFEASLKRKAWEHPEQPPAQLLRAESQGVLDIVLSQLQLQSTIVKSLQRNRQKELLAAPTKLQDNSEIPAMYQKTLVGEQFLLHDSRPLSDATMKRQHHSKC